MALATCLFCEECFQHCNFDRKPQKYMGCIGYVPGNGQPDTGLSLGPLIEGAFDFQNNALADKILNDISGVVLLNLM